MHLPLALEGVSIGLSVAAPVGPLSTLTMRRTIDRGFAAGIVSGLGIALGDATYGAIAAFGFTSLSDLLIDHQQLIRLAGGIALFYIGAQILRTARTPSVARLDSMRSSGFRRTAGTMYLLTLANPVTILSFAAIFGGLGVALGNSAGESLLLVTGVFFGSMIWWWVLCGLLANVRHRLAPRWISRIDFAAGAVILAMASISIVTGLR
jgi:putative LysE/RhtB family amino acid efflux pump